jgi:hypothetical protein
MMGGQEAAKKAVLKAVYLVDQLEMTGQTMVDLMEHEKVAAKAGVKGLSSVEMLGYPQVASKVGSRVALKADSLAGNLVAPLAEYWAVVKAACWAALRAAE